MKYRLTAVSVLTMFWVLAHSEQWAPLVLANAWTQNHLTLDPGTLGWSLAALVTHLGDYCGNGLAAVVAVRLYRTRPLEFLEFALLLVGNLALAQNAKTGFHTVRPPLAEANPTFAYPSGHTLFTACLFGFLSRRYRPLLLVPVLVGWSRLALGQHWLTDVLGGLSLGWLWVSICRHLAARAS